MRFGSEAVNFRSPDQEQFVARDVERLPGDGEDPFSIQEEDHLEVVVIVGS